MTDEELIEEREPLAGLVPVGEPRVEKRSLVYTFSFPPQDHRIDVGSDVSDPVTREGAGAVVGLDETNRTIELKRGPKLAGTPLPTALVPNGVIPTTELAESLLRTGEQIAKEGLAGGGAGDGTRRPGPRRRPGPAAADAAGRRARERAIVSDGETPLDAAVRLAPDLAGRVLPVQGPPGSGKTYTGAHMIVRLAMAGQRVGVVANSHKVIGNLLEAADRVAREQLAAGGIARAGDDRPEAEDGPRAVVLRARRRSPTTPRWPRRCAPAPATSSARWRGPGAVRRWRSRSRCWTS